jgi:uncharacterized membrane protein
LNIKALYIKLIFAALIIVWYAGIYYKIFFPDDSSNVFPGILLDRLYSLVCHQENAKSFFVAGQKLEVCARCTGIYTGGLIFSIAALLIPALKPRSAKGLILAIFPMAADVLLYSIGIYDYSIWVAFTTGLILGSAAILYIFTGIEDYILELNLSPNVQ